MSRTERSRSIRGVLYITLVLNALVAFAKIYAGYATNFTSITADGFHSLTDGGSNIIALIGLVVSAKPADPRHPYGHRKFETLSAMGISFLILMTCFNVLKGVWVKVFGEGPLPETNVLNVAIICCTIGVNLFVTIYEARVGKRLKSEILIADSQHTRSDVLVSLSVLVTLGAVHFRLFFMDTVCAVVVAGFIFKAGYGIIIHTIDVLADAQQMDPEAIATVVRAVPGAVDAHKIRTRGSDDKVFVDLHLLVDPDMTIVDAHEVAEDVEKAIRRKYPGIYDVTSHIEPATAEELDGADARLV